MWPRLSIVAGLVVGIAAAALVLGSILAFAPEQPVPSLPVASFPIIVVSPVPSPSASPSAGPSASPSAGQSASPSARPSASPGPSTRSSPGATASGAAALFHIGEKAPSLVLPQVGGIGPDVIARGSGTILPGVHVTP